MRIDEKEDLIHDMCDRYGLELSYAWGIYYISVSNTFSKCKDITKFSRADLEGWGISRIEEVVLGCVLDSGVW